MPRKDIIRSAEQALVFHSRSATHTLVSSLYAEARHHKMGKTGFGLSNMYALRQCLSRSATRMWVFRPYTKTRPSKISSRNVGLSYMYALKQDFSRPKTHAFVFCTCTRTGPPKITDVNVVRSFAHARPRYNERVQCLPECQLSNNIPWGPLTD